MWVRDRANLISNLMSPGTIVIPNYAICGVVNDIMRSDCKVLVDLYESTNGSGWTNKTNWMGIGDPTPTTACDWFGLTCGASRVATISIASNNMSGVLPATIVNLTGMNTLWLRFNQLTGSVPSLSTMTSLTSIYLDGNNLN
jgi:hypothetical protein